MAIDRTQPIAISAGETGFAWCVDRRGELRQLAFGPGAATATIDFPKGLYPRALPAFGTEPLRRTAVRVTHHDGTRSTRLRVDGFEREPTAHGERLTIALTDPDLGLGVSLVTETWTAFDLLTQWVEVTNHEPGPVTVWECASSAPLLAAADPTWTHMGGGWAAEWTPTTEALHNGVKVVESAGGVRPALQNMPMFLVSPDGPWTETEGTVIAGSLAWTGNSCFEAEVSERTKLRLLCGESFRAGEIVLDPGQTLVTPTMAWAWSSEGIGPLSRRLHRWVRRHRVRDGLRDRAIVANNWEATFFDFDEARLIGLARDAADLGAELFLLDDGWFGTSHPRDDDTQGLGDWEVDTGKLPNDLDPVIAATLDAGLRFGLWVEPEMVNPGSTLYAEHPEWVVGDPVRPEPNLERAQLVLDLLQPEVADFAVATIDRLLQRYPDISYLKWDANRSLVETGSRALPPDRQGRVFHDSVEALWSVMRRVAAAHPDVEMMLCASGGGRVDTEALRSFHEIWTSDNTDPRERVRMQWAASWFLPPSVLGAHVTSWGGQPVGFAAAVAMSARFGWDIDTAALSEAERSVLRTASETYKRIRPLVQHGDLRRLISPFDGPRAALAYVSPEQDRAVVFGYQLDPADAEEVAVMLDLGAADADLTVTSTTLDGEVSASTISSAELATDGLPWLLTQPSTAIIWEIEGRRVESDSEQSGVSDENEGHG